MAFVCQRDSYMKEYSTKVVSCTSSKLKTIVNNKKEVLEGFEIILEDTVLFPEGGGQPSDKGLLNDVPVLQVSRRGTQAVHFTQTPLEEGQEVKQVVDWDRRFDHMQQHSGQHLVTAIADQVYGYPTTSWWLGEQDSYIELDAPSIKDEEIRRIEEKVNEKIRQSVPVTVRVYEEGDPELKGARSPRGLPDDYHGPVRVVRIEDVEDNMCCGTHVSNLSHLQAIKLLHAEKGKKNKINLHFVAGNRVLKFLENCLQREQALTALLKNAPSIHVELVDKLQKSLKVSQKNLQSALKDVAALEAHKLKSQVPYPTFFSLHRKDADTDFISIFINEVSDENILLFLTVGDEKGAGHMVLHGDPEKVKILGPQVCSILGGKGAGKGAKFQAKVNNLGNRSKAEDLLRQELGIKVT